MDIHSLSATVLNRLVTEFPLDGCHLIGNGGVSIFSTKEWQDRKEYVINQMTFRQEAYGKKTQGSKKATLRYEKHLARFMPIFDVEEVQVTGQMSALHLHMFLDFILFPPYGWKNQNETQ